MRKPSDRETGGARLVWERPEPAPRPVPGPLSRERIVRAALAIADQEGLAAVSLRKIGALLGAGPMRLYGYIATKEELLELMADAIYGEMAVPPAGADWREALRSLARDTRRVALAHPWFIELLGGRPRLGPQALGRLEAWLAALGDAPGFENIDLAMQAVRTVNAYVIGAIRSEASELDAELDSGLDEAAWQTATGPYIVRMLATGRFPHLARVVRDADHPPPDIIFEQGLDYVIDGIAARSARRT